MKPITFNLVWRMQNLPALEISEVSSYEALTHASSAETPFLHLKMMTFCIRNDEFGVKMMKPREAVSQKKEKDNENTQCCGIGGARLRMRTLTCKITSKLSVATCNSVTSNHAKSHCDEECVCTCVPFRTASSPPHPCAGALSWSYPPLA